MGRALLSEDVPRILAEIRGEIVKGTSANDTVEAADDVEEARETTESMEITDGEDLPSLSGATKQERLASFVAMTTSLLRQTPPPLPALRALVAQLTKTLDDVTISVTEASDELTDDVTKDDAKSAEKGAKKSAKKAAKKNAKKDAEKGNKSEEKNKTKAEEVELSRPAGWADWVKLVLKKGLRQAEVGEAILGSLTLLCEKGLFPSSGGGTAQTEVSLQYHVSNCSDGG